MKLFFIRHGDPDYKTDTLTEKGVREAGLLAKRMTGTHVDYCYASPLGRAQLTAAPCLEAMNMEATTYEWLREFDPQIVRPDSPERTHICWDWLPQDWTRREHFYKYDEWFNDDILNAADIKKHAMKMGCNAIVNLRIVSVDGSYAVVYGDGVVIRPKSAPAPDMPEVPDFTNPDNLMNY